MAPWVTGGDLGGSKSRFGLGRGFFAPNQKIQKNKYVFICPINTTPPLVSQNFEIGTLSYPPNKVGAIAMPTNFGGSRVSYSPGAAIGSLIDP